MAESRITVMVHHVRETQQTVIVNHHGRIAKISPQRDGFLLDDNWIDDHQHGTFIEAFVKALIDFGIKFGKAE